MKKPKKQKRPRVRSLALTREDTINGALWCLSLVFKDGPRDPFFKSYDAQETMDEFVAATEKYKLRVDFKIAAKLEKH